MVKIIFIILTIGMSVPSFFSAIIFAWIFGFLLKDLSCLGLPMGSFINLISLHCAIHPGNLPRTNITVYMSEGIPIAL